MIVDNNSTKNATNSTSSKSLITEMSLAEKEKTDDKPLDAKKNVTNSSNSTDSFDQILENMTFAVNDTLNKGWPLRRDDGFPYQE
jgi:hypothetical protein